VRRRAGVGLTSGWRRASVGLARSGRLAVGSARVDQAAPESFGTSVRQAAGAAHPGAGASAAAVPDLRGRSRAAISVGAAANAGLAPAATAPSAAAKAPVAKRADKPAPDAELPKGPAWAVVRLERKGRAGKEATIVEKLALAAPELERWCKELKQALGCGGVVEGDSIVLQGDLRSRLPAVLTKRGAGEAEPG
jgi:translation initiation factor 1